MVQYLSKQAISGFSLLAKMHLAAVRGDVEQAFGGPVEWERLDGKRACRIRKQIDLGGYLDEQKWPKIQEEMVDAMIRLHTALSPHIQYLKE